MFSQQINDDFFRLQEGLVNNIHGAIEYLNENLMEYSNGYLEQNNKITVELMFIGIIILIFIDIFVFNNVYNSKIREMDSLVTFVFLTPQQVVDKSEKFKR